MILTWNAHDDGAVVSQRVLMSLDGDIVQGNLTEPVVTLAEGLSGGQRSIKFVVPAPQSRFFGHANIRVEATDDLGQVGWDDLYLYLENDEQGQLLITTNPEPLVTAGQNLGQACWTPQGINPFGGSVDAYLLIENTDSLISLGGVTTGLNCLALDLTAPFVSTDRARIVLSLFTGGGVLQPEYYYGEPFAIRPDPRVGDAAPTVVMTSPATGASFEDGSVVPIRWTASDDQFVRAFHIQASTDGGRTWSFIARDLPGVVAAFDWQLPPYEEAGEISVKVIAVDRRFQDTAAIAPFTVVPGDGEPPCAADWDADGSLNSNDFFAFLDSYFTGDADFDADGATNSNDFFAFLTAFFEGCM
jgi:hypothetical protein